MTVMTPPSTTEVPTTRDDGFESASWRITPMTVLIAGHGVAAALLLAGGAWS